MKLKAVVVLLICCSLSFQSCWLTDTEDDVLPQMQDYYEPVTMQRSEFNATTILQATAEVIINSGKIYVKDNFIFINEHNKGFHIIDNTDPTNHQNIAFLNVLGS
jgi:hypothetical protein